MIGGEQIGISDLRCSLGLPFLRACFLTLVNCHLVPYTDRPFVSCLLSFVELDALLSHRLFCIIDITYTLSCHSHSHSHTVISITRILGTNYCSKPAPSLSICFKHESGRMRSTACHNPNPARSCHLPIPARRSASSTTSRSSRSRTAEKQRSSAQLTAYPHHLLHPLPSHQSRTPPKIYAFITGSARVPLPLVSSSDPRHHHHPMPKLCGIRMIS